MNSKDKRELDEYRRLERVICPAGMNFAQYIVMLGGRRAKEEAPLWEGHLTGGESDRQSADHCLTEGIKDDG